MRLKKLLIIVAIILFPWLSILFVVYYVWKQGFVRRMLKQGAWISNKLPKGAGEVREESVTYSYYNLGEDCCYILLPRTLGFQYLYAIDICDLPERLKQNIEEIIRTATAIMGGSGRSTISLIVEGDIKRVRVHSISRVTPRWSDQVRREVEELSLRFADALGLKSPTVRVSICKGRKIMESLILEGSR